jgi:hypothetical protein
MNLRCSRHFLSNQHQLTVTGHETGRCSVVGDGSKSFMPIVDRKVMFTKKTRSRGNRHVSEVEVLFCLDC